MISDEAYLRQWYYTQFQKGIKEGHPPSIVGFTVAQKMMNKVFKDLVIEKKEHLKPALFNLNGTKWYWQEGDYYHCEGITERLSDKTLRGLQAKPEHIHTCKYKQTSDSYDCDCGAV